MGVHERAGRGVAVVDEDYDYIIIGAGSAGCVIANRLSSDRSRRVLLIEAGGWGLSPYVHIPAGLVLLQEKYDWNYKAEPDASRNGVVDEWAAGKMLGGSSSINGMLWVRGHRADFDGWRDLGCPGWDYASVLPYFVRAETYERPGGPYRGVSGPQHVSHVRTIHPLTEAFVEAAIERGYAFNSDYNGPTQEGVGHAQVSQHGGLRVSTARAYLVPALRRRNLKITTHAEVRRVVMQGGRAVGVEFVKGGKHYSIGARREVIVSAGALASPKLLMLSGIGPARMLETLGIPVVAANQGVGQNLQDHLSSMLSWHVDMPTLNVEVSPQAFVRHGLDYVVRRNGPGASPYNHSVVFGHFGTPDGPSDFEGMFSPMAFAIPNAGGSVHDIHGLKLHGRPAVNLLPAVLHPDGRGAVGLRSSDPRAPITIEHEYAGRSGDLDRLFQAVQRLREIMAAPAMARHIVDERMPGPDVGSDQELRAWLGTACHGSAHPVGTCKMGTDDDAVVDPELRVKGVEGLRVADASIFPTLTSGNTNAPVIMVGEKASDLILGFEGGNVALV
jgi:choline dehydrogenase